MPSVCNVTPTKIVVLSDGETFDLLENCEVVELPQSVDPNNTDAIEQFLRNR